MPRPDRAPGFTLFEVLMALAIAAVALAGLGRLIGVYVNTSAEVQARLYGHWVASNQIVIGALENPWPKAGASDGESELAGHRWEWRQEVGESTFAQVRRIEIQVFDRPEAEDYVTRLAGYVGENSPW